ncbi:MAG TPA: choice-of-anchor tandem repeat GloVer-containing protein [Bryocella sp.]|nr:choice-of-anchor tandem repeat GloVer-containing protein [Bryocella sp.]
MRGLATSFFLFAVFVVVLSPAGSQSAQAQSFQVLYAFTNGIDGATPFSGITVDGAGNLYGTTSLGGKLTCNPPWGCGTAYRLKRSGSSYTFSPLYGFEGGADGSGPESRLNYGPDGALYGTTDEGGSINCGGLGCGTVFKLLPPAAAFCHSLFCPWKETVLYSFSGSSDGYWPFSADLLFDSTGNIYGTVPYTTYGSDVYGVAYELTRSNGGYTQSVLHSFAGSDGSQPWNSGLIADSAGNLYGTTAAGGLYGYGTVFELTNVAGTWTETVLHNFDDYDGSNVFAGLVADQPGNLYGATNIGGSTGGGTIFELSPGASGWTFNTLYTFPHNGCGPQASLIIDAAGDLYGAQACGGAHGAGAIFKLAFSNGNWTYTSLHDFNFTDGDNPSGRLTQDSSGNLYGTTVYGGDYNGLCQNYGCGVVWKITP